MVIASYIRFIMGSREYLSSYIPLSNLHSTDIVTDNFMDIVSNGWYINHTNHESFAP